jgi:hypothetical protein
MAAPLSPLRLLSHRLAAPCALFPPSLRARAFRACAPAPARTKWRTLLAPAQAATAELAGVLRPEDIGVLPQQQVNQG